MAPTEIRPAHEFDQFPGTHGDEGELCGHLLVEVNAAGRAEDHFRVVLTGGHKLSHTFGASALVDCPALAQFTLTYEKAPASLSFKTNSFATKWENLDELVAAERVQACTDDLDDADDAFRTAWGAAKATDQPAAAALRWALQAHETYGFKVVLQGLPATARSLRSDARLTADSGRTIELASWVAATPMENGGGWKGPAPLLFSTDPAGAALSCGKHPERLSAGKTL